MEYHQSANRQFRTLPPSAAIVWPVTKDESFEHMNEITPTIVIGYSDRPWVVGRYFPLGLPFVRIRIGILLAPRWWET